VFRAGVKVAAAQGLVGLICHAVEGTKIRAVASRRTVEHRKDREKLLGRGEASIAKMATGVEGAEKTEVGEYRLPEGLQEAEKLRQAIRETVGDGGYARAEPLGEAQARGYEVLVAPGSETGGAKRGDYDSSKFEYASA